MDGSVDEALTVRRHAVAAGKAERLLQTVDEAEEIEGGDTGADGLVLQVRLFDASAFFVGATEQAPPEGELGTWSALRKDPDTEGRQHVGSKRKRTTGRVVLF